MLHLYKHIHNYSDIYIWTNEGKNESRCNQLFCSYKK